MAYFIRLEVKEDLEWLEGLLNNGMQKLRAGASMLEAASENIVRVHDAVINAVPAKEAEALGITEEEFPEDIKKAKRQAKRKPKDDYVPNLCPNHPKNEFKRAPRTDCEGCWDAYKRLHPMEFDKARRNWERKNA